MTSADIGLVQEILSFRILIERVLGALSAHRRPQELQVERLAGRFAGAVHPRRVVQRGVRAAGSSGAFRGRRSPREAAPTDAETVDLLGKLARNEADAVEMERLVELLKVADRDLTRSRMKVPIGRFL